MKSANSIFIIVIMLVFSGSVFAQQEFPTIKDMMQLLEDKYDIKFVYESELDVDVICSGVKADSGDVDKNLRKVFRGSGIKWRRNGNYVVLTKGMPEYEDCEIMEMRDTLAESRIISEKFMRIRARGGLKAMDGSEFNRGYAAFSSPDLVKSLHSYTGVQSGTEMLSGLYVHGGTGRDNLFLLDGVPLYGMNHAAGIFSSFNTDVVDNVNFYKSGFPACFGGRLSSVVDISTREGDFYEYHGMVSVGLLDGRLQFEGPVVKGRTSFSVSLRRSWLDALTGPHFKFVRMSPNNNYRFSYSFHDMNAKLVHKFSEDNRLSLNVFSGRDALRYMRTVPASFMTHPNYPNWNSNTVHKGNNEGDMSMKWGNFMTSLNWDYDISDELSLRAILYYTRAESDVDYRESIYAWDSGAGDNHFVTENDTFLVLDDASAKADFAWKPHKNHSVRFGGQYLLHLYSPERTFAFSRHPDKGEVQGESEGYANLYTAHESSVYMEDEMHLSDWFDLTAGLRYTMYVSDGKIWNGLEPRVAANVRFNENMALKASYVEMNQYSHGISTVAADLPMNFWMPSTGKVKPMHARQFAAEFIMNLPYDMYLELGGFHKTMDGLYEYAGTNHLFPDIAVWETDFVEGEGLAYGAEAALGWTGKKMDMNVRYTLSWSGRLFEDFYPDWYYDGNDSRHKLTVDYAYRINDRINLYALWNYHTGLWTNIHSNRPDPCPENFPDRYYSGPNNVRLPDYHRLDVGANFRRVTKRGNESIWNLSIYNVYCRMNPLFLSESSDDGKEESGLKAFSAFPILPSFSYTFKF